MECPGPVRVGWDGTQAVLASGIIWHLEPQQGLGPITSQSPEQCVWGGELRRVGVRERGPEAWLLEQGHMYLIVLGAQRKLMT